MRVGRALLAICLASMWFAPPARAQTDDASRAAARDLATAGVDAYQHEDFAGASAKLDKAYRVLRVPSIGLWSARALVKVGQLVKASERYREVMRLTIAEGDAAVQKQAQTEAVSELDALTQRIPRIVIKLEGAQPEEAALTVDGVAVSSALLGESRVVDPGRHVIAASRGGQAAQVEVTLAEGESRDVTLKFQPGAPAASAPAPVAASAPVGAAPPASSGGSDTGLGTQRTLALVVAGVGVVGVGVGGVFGLQAKSKLADADQAGCAGASCPTQTGLDLNDDAMSAGNVSTIAFAIGAAGLVGGAVLWFTGAPAERATARIGAGPGGIKLQAVW